MTDLNASRTYRVEIESTKSERALKLDESVSLAVRKALDEVLLNDEVSDQLLGEFIPDPDERRSLMIETRSNIWDTFQSYQYELLDQHQVVEQVALLERSLNEWVPKTEALLKCDPEESLEIDSTPNPVDLEYHKSSNYLKTLEQSIQDYKEKISGQRKHIQELVETINNKLLEVDSRLEKTHELTSEFAASHVKQWADSQLASHVS